MSIGDWSYWTCPHCSDRLAVELSHDEGECSECGSICSHCVEYGDPCESVVIEPASAAGGGA